jgi:hypothetical protein
MSKFHKEINNVAVVAIFEVGLPFKETGPPRRSLMPRFTTTYVVNIDLDRTRTSSSFSASLIVERASGFAQVLRYML